MGCPGHIWVEVESMDYFSRYCYKCEATEDFVDTIWIPSNRKLFKR